MRGTGCLLLSVFVRESVHRPRKIQTQRNTQNRRSFDDDKLLHIVLFWVGREPVEPVVEL